MATKAPATGVPSPCINICRMHAATGWCEGCLRTLDEVATWGRMDEAARLALIDRLAPRRTAWRLLQDSGAAPIQPAPRGGRR